MRKITTALICLLTLCCATGFAAADNNVKPDDSIFKDTMVEMTWPEVQEAAARGAIVIFPVAVVEEHGPHMDLSPDIYQTCLGCRFIKQELARKGIAALLAPPYYWGINRSTGAFPGSFTVKNETMKAVLADSAACLKAWGFTKIFFANLHGDSIHNAVLETAVQEIRAGLGIDAYNVQSIKARLENPPVFPPAREGKFYPDYHAGADETVTMWAYYPDHVKADVAEKLKPQTSFADPLGYVGDPGSFKLEKGAAESLQVLAKQAALLIEACLKQK